MHNIAIGRRGSVKRVLMSLEWLLWAISINCIMKGWVDVDGLRVSYVFVTLPGDVLTTLRRHHGRNLSRKAFVLWPRDWLDDVNSIPGFTADTTRFAAVATTAGGTKSKPSTVRDAMDLEWCETGKLDQSWYLLFLISSSTVEWTRSIAPPRRRRPQRLLWLKWWIQTLLHMDGWMACIWRRLYYLCWALDRLMARELSYVLLHWQRCQLG